MIFAKPFSYQNKQKPIIQGAISLTLRHTYLRNISYGYNRSFFLFDTVHPTALKELSTAFHKTCFTFVFDAAEMKKNETC